MAASLDKSVICRVLVGRASYLQALGTLIEQVCGGRGHTVLVSGEAGIGKSRLMAEALAAARTRRMHGNQPGLLVFQGRCFEPDRALPYAPLLDLLHTFFSTRSPDDLVREAGSAAPELVKLLPELATVLPDLAPTPAFEPEQEKRRLFQALTQFFTCLATRQPLLIVVEDVHWSDDTSLEVLLYLARRLEPHPILLLLTYRSDEVHPSLAHFLALLDRERVATELALSRLTASEVDAMMRAILELNRPVPAGFLDLMYALTEGNPFFIEETLKSLITASELHLAEGVWDWMPIEQMRIPRSVQDAVQRRVVQLSPAARRVLTLAAVAGRRFDFALLQQVTGCAEDDLLCQIKELIAAQLVVEESAERFAFRHALTRQAIYVQLLARERQALHRTIADTLQRLYAATPDAHLGELAYHSYEAGAWDQALDYSYRVGRQAHALYAPRAAIEHLTRALEAAGRLSMAPPPELYRVRGLAYATLGDFVRAHADHDAALQAASAAADRRAEWQALLDLGLLWASRDYARTGEYCRRALDLARAMGDPATLGHTLNRLGNWHANVEQPLDGQRHHQEALALFQELGDRHGLAETVDLLGMTSYTSGNLIDGRAYYERAVALVRDLDDRQGVASSLTSLAELSGINSFTDTAVSAAMPVDERVHTFETALKVAREIGWRSQEAYTLLQLASFLGPLGAYARALEAARTGLAIAEEIEHRQWMTFAHCMLGMLYRDLLALPPAQEHLERAMELTRMMNSPFWVYNVTEALAATYVLHNDYARAESILNTALALDAPTETMGQRRVWSARAELTLARGGAPQALHIVDRLMASTPNVSEERIVPRLWKLRGEALAMLHRVADAESVLRAALDGAAAQELRPLVWRIHVILGRLLAD
jgi:tetratricopeptide (TPR) repeat protein